MFSNPVLLEVVILTPRLAGCSRTSTRKLHCSFQRPTAKKDSKKLKIQQQPPVSGKFDLIGPPDPISNVRPIQFHVPLKETATEKSFRLRHSEILQWNQNFWAHHNSSFFKEKENYILEHQEIDSDGKTSISAEKLSVFYKRFLDENRISHLNYNREWYKQNISLLWPALKVTFIRLTRKFDRNS
ncbi:APOPT family protein Y39B6A.34 mitochondrial [Biomphalaria pfeifferi]|uniref:APOPT family protein Y39B6A.34 mitochondrial n=1 Tax=Biomphalaria pfeifferi TaxID=112525 RepID=A0AAD8B0E6_BIOPF|nr:APOPT family protein Y39B6A.34 mitochondrial [Biomphalaria pfeifferi]